MKRFLFALVIAAALPAEEPKPALKPLTPLTNAEIIKLIDMQREAEPVLRRGQELRNAILLQLERDKLEHGAAGCDLSPSYQWINCAKSTPSGPAKKGGKGK